MQQTNLNNKINIAFVTDNRLVADAIVVLLPDTFCATILTPEEVDILSPEDLAEKLDETNASIVVYYVRHNSKSDEETWQTNVVSAWATCQAALQCGTNRLILIGTVNSLGAVPESGKLIDAVYQSDKSRPLYHRALRRQEAEAWQAAEKGLPLTVILTGDLNTKTTNSYTTSIEQLARKIVFSSTVKEVKQRILLTTLPESNDCILK